MSADSFQQNELVKCVSVADLQSAVRIACDAATLGAVSVKVSRDRHPPEYLVTVHWPSTGLPPTFEAWWSDVHIRLDRTWTTGL
jgi:hypothetical protein